MVLQPERYQEVAAAKYVYHNGNDEVGIIDGVDLQSGDGRKITVTGRLLEGLLDNRVIDQVHKIENQDVATAVRQIVTASGRYNKHDLD